MIGLPQADFIHAFHIGVSGKKTCSSSSSISIVSLGETFGDVTCLSGVEKSELLKISVEKSSSTVNDTEAVDDELGGTYQLPIEPGNDSSPTVNI